ncbi:MAG: N-acetyltransferase family protein [Syntrophobacteraceae bacterium]
MKLLLEPLSVDARHAVVDIFNYYVENSFSAYPEKTVSYDFFDTLLNMCKGYPSAVARNEGGEVIGFGMLRPFNAMPAFSRTAEITYFLKPGCTGLGVGKAILDHLTARGKERGLTSILAGISSLNEGSIRFHLKNGFSECGRFRGVGLKKGIAFDMVYCQKIL